MEPLHAHTPTRVFFNRVGVRDCLLRAHICVSINGLQLDSLQVLVGVRAGLSIAHAQVWATTLGWLKGSFSTA